MDDNILHKHEASVRQDQGYHWWDRFRSYMTDRSNEELYSLPFKLKKFFPSVEHDVINASHYGYLYCLYIPSYLEQPNRWSITICNTNGMPPGLKSRLVTRRSMARTLHRINFPLPPSMSVVPFSESSGSSPSMVAKTSSCRPCRRRRQRRILQSMKKEAPAWKSGTRNQLMRVPAVVFSALVGSRGKLMSPR